MLVEIPNEGIEHSLSDTEARIIAGDIITDFAGSYGVSQGRVALETRDNTGKLIESREASLVPGEAHHLSFVRPGAFSVLVKLPEEGQPTLAYLPATGPSLHNSFEASLAIKQAVSGKPELPRH